MLIYKFKPGQGKSLTPWFRSLRNSQFFARKSRYGAYAVPTDNFRSLFEVNEN